MKPYKSISKQFMIIVLLLIYCPFTIADKIYKWTDENGKVHFGDKPPLSGQVKEVKPSSTRAIQKKDAHAGERTRLSRSTNKRKMISLPDGTKYPAPRTKAEIDALENEVQRIIKQRMNRARKARTLNIPGRPKKQAKAFYNKSQLGAVPLQSSFGKKHVQQINVLDGELKKRTGQIGIDAIQRPIPADSMFPDCDSKNLKPGTERSGFCDLWDEHLTYLNGRLKKECTLAGEKIYKTVSNVEGFLLRGLQKSSDSPKRSYRSNVIHELPARSFRKFLVPRPARLYRQIEYFDNRQEVYLTNKITGIRKGAIGSTWSHTPKIDTETFYSPEPQSNFEVGYMNLTSNEDHEQGFFGDLTWVKDRRTNETLAERTIYYFMVKDGVRMVDGARLKTPRGWKSYYGRNIRFFYPCESYVPRVTQLEKHHPKNEYEFVSRVLIPTPFTKEENHYLYNLAIADGNIRRECVGLQTLGPGITLENLLVTRVKDDLKLKVKGGDSSLTCRSFFRGPHWSVELMFADGLYWQENQILEHGDIVWEKN